MLDIGFAIPSWWDGQYADAEIEDALDQLVALGVTSVSIVPTWYTATLGDTAIYGTQQTESPASIAHVIAAAKARGLEVMYKPHLDPESGGWRAEYDPADPDAWFASYRSFILEQAALAAEAGADTMTIGTELVSMTAPEHTSQWRSIIADIREIYSGRLTYAAIPEEARQIAFWDDLDAVGINPYVQLAPDGNGTVESLAAAWDEVPTDDWHYNVTGGRSPFDAMRVLAEQWGKPVLITELGYRAVDGAATSPGDWELEAAPDEQEQADLYDAFFTFFSEADADWLEGAMFWHWEVTDTPRDRPWNWSDTGYTPQSRLAEDVIANWLGTGVQTPQTGTDGGDSLSGTEYDDTLRGEAGADLLQGGAGDDRLYGGKGNDTLVVGTGTDYLSGGKGRDLVDFSSDEDGLVIDLSQDMAEVTHTGGVAQLVGIESILGGRGSDRISGSGGKERLNGGAGDDRLDGKGGKDRLTGGDGDDTLKGGGGKDVLQGDDGRDKLLGGGGADKLQGGEGKDNLKGGDGNDRLQGAASHDRLDGGKGNDSLIGGAGDDLLTGGKGADTFIFTDDDGHDTITDLMLAQGDVIDLTALNITRFSDLSSSIEITRDGNSLILLGDDNSIEIIGITSLNLLQELILL